MVKTSFNACTLDYLEKTFGLELKFDTPVLEKWLHAPIELSSIELNELQKLRELLRLNAPHWNEQELSIHFIGPILSMANLTSTKFNLFAQRYISATVDGVELSGKPDGILASGFRSPDKPFFAFQEYKKEQDPNGDPAGQALAAMLVGQTLNDQKHPIYGCYINGRAWNFMVLEGKTYSISQDYSAVTEDITDILKILKALRPIVINLLK